MYKIVEFCKNENSLIEIDFYITYNIIVGEEYGEYKE